MQKRDLFLVRIIAGIVLVIIGVAFLGVIFNPRGLLVPFDDRPFFVFMVFAIGITIGFGAWLLSGYPLRMFLEPALVIGCWTFLFVLPILLLPLSLDMLSLVLSLSLLLLVIIYGNYAKWKKKRKK